MLIDQEKPLSLRDAARIGFRHLRLATSVFVVVFGAAVAAVVFLPKSYVSEGKLFVRIGRSSVSLDPTASVGHVVTLSESREREINSALEVLKSHELLEAVLERIGPEAVLRQDRALVRPIDPTAPPIDELVREKALIRLKKSFKYEPNKNSNVVTVSFTAKSPALAQLVLQSYFAAFQSHHLRLNRTEGSYEFFAEQASQLERQLEAAKERLRSAKNRIRVTSIDDEKHQLEQQLTALQQSLASTKAAIAASDSNLQELRRGFTEEDEPPVSEVSPQAMANMKVELYKLQIQERELTSSFSAVHPRVIILKEQVEQSKRLLARQEYASERSNGLALRASVEELQRQFDAKKQTLLKLNDDDVAMRSLEQEVRTIETNYSKYLDAREQARINGALEDVRISNVNVAQQPTFRPEPAGVGDLMVLILGVLAGGFAALIATLVSEYFDDTFQVPEDLESALHVPVVLTVPRARSEVFSLG